MTNGSNGSALAVAAATGITKAAQHETAISAAAAQAQAVVQARFFMAYQRPRDIDDVRVKLLKACDRPRFAETAIYRKPMGKKQNPDTGKWEQQFIEGPSIRFAEECARALGNVDVQVPILYDDVDKRIISVQVADLESNTTYSEDIIIQKTVERRELKRGQISKGERMNSYGEVVYLVEATDDDTATKSGALKSKAMRNCLMRVLPSDIKEEAIERCYETMRKGDAADPDAARKRLADAFSQVGVSPSELKKYVGHELSSCSPAEIGELRKVYTAIKEGETTWAEELKLHNAEGTPVAGAQPAQDAAKSRAQGAKDATRAKAAAAAKPEAEKPAEAKPADATPVESKVEREPGSDDEPDFEKKY